MANFVDPIYRQWSRIGVLFGATPSRRSPDLERLLLDTARCLPGHPRLLDAAVSWLACYGNFVARHRLKHLIQTELQPAEQPALGLLLDRAIHLGASPELRLAASVCARADQPGPLFEVHQASAFLRDLAKRHADRTAKRWGLWCPPTPLKREAIRPATWIITRNPAYVQRIIRKGDLRCTILLTLIHDLPGQSARSEFALARQCSANRPAIRSALQDLETEGFIRRMPSPIVRRGTAIQLVRPRAEMHAA